LRPSSKFFLTRLWLVTTMRLRNLFRFSTNWEVSTCRQLAQLPLWTIPKSCSGFLMER
jgi:hypothetical protein